MGEQLERETTVVFAQVAGGAELAAKAGDAAAEAALAACLDRLKKAAEACGARVIKRAAARLMVLLPRPDAAADAAAAMHSAMDDLPQAAHARLALGIGFHHGPVGQRDDEVWGETVNLAAQIVEQAANGQTITTRETASHLSPLYRAWMRKLYSVDIKGRAGQVALCELVWRADDNATLFARTRTTRVANTTLTLVYGDKTIVRRRDRDCVTIGRDPYCGIAIIDDRASRLHCTIERRQDKWFLIDHSTNGTYLSVDGADDVLVQREEFTLTGRGRIACGQPSVSTQEVVSFTVE